METTCYTDRICFDDVKNTGCLVTSINFQHKAPALKGPATRGFRKNWRRGCQRKSWISGITGTWDLLVNRFESASAVIAVRCEYEVFVIFVCQVEGYWKSTHVL